MDFQKPALPYFCYHIKYIEIGILPTRSSWWLSAVFHLLTSPSISSCLFGFSTCLASIKSSNKGPQNPKGLGTSGKSVHVPNEDTALHSIHVHASQETTVQHLATAYQPTPFLYLFPNVSTKNSLFCQEMTLFMCWTRWQSTLRRPWSPLLCLKILEREGICRWEVTGKDL